MMRNLKICMTLAAVLAIGAIGAGTAQAGALDVGPTAAGVISAWTTGTQTAPKNHKFTVTSVSGVVLTSLVCSNTSYDITISGLSSNSAVSVSEMTATPTAAGCELGGLAASVATGSCKYTFSGEGTAALTFNMSIVGCTSTLTVTQGTCVLSIPSTSVTLEKVTFTSVAGPPKHVLMTLALRKIPITGGTGCPANLQAAGNTADLSGTTTTKAFSDLNGEEGAQINLEAT
jgi:hypothetical protein